MQRIILGLILVVGAPLWGVLAYQDYGEGRMIMAAGFALVALGGFAAGLMLLKQGFRAQAAGRAQDANDAQDD
ncbi:MAG: hypothetical protein ACOY99_02290 [Pseudomonadota bacterium]|jgi:hypothetical protein